MRLELNYQIPQRHHLHVHAVFVSTPSVVSTFDHHVRRCRRCRVLEMGFACGVLAANAFPPGAVAHTLRPLSLDHQFLASTHRPRQASRSSVLRRPLANASAIEFSVVLNADAPTFI